MKLGVYLVLLAISFNTFAQSEKVVENTTKSQLGREESPLEITYRFRKMQLVDTAKTEDYRLNHFAVVPTNIATDLQILGLRYKATQNLTYSLSSTHMKNTVDVAGFVPMGRPGPNTPIASIEETYKSQGWSDARLGVTYKVFGNQSEKSKSKSRHQLTLKADLSIPVGSIDETYSDGRGSEHLMPYSGQLGTGTYDFIPQASYSYTLNSWKSGTFARYRLHSGKNKKGYKLGDQTYARLWTGYQLAWFLEAKTMLNYRSWFRANDPEISTSNSKDPYFKGGQRWEALAVVNAWLPITRKARLTFEYGTPFYQGQSSGDAELETDWYLVSALEASF